MRGNRTISRKRRVNGWARLFRGELVCIVWKFEERGGGGGFPDWSAIRRVRKLKGAMAIDSHIAKEPSGSVYLFGVNRRQCIEKKD